MSSIEIFVIICGFIVGFFVVWRFYRKPKLRAASGEILTRWGVLYGTPRLFYGSERTKPDIDCFWDKNADLLGWYETDANLRIRIINLIANRKYGL